MISRIFMLLAMLTLAPRLAIAQQQGQVKCVRDNVGNIYCPKHQPVDLSRIGLEGIETANRTRESQARIKALEAQTRAYEAQQQRDNAALSRQAIVASPPITKQSCTTDDCLEQESYRRADATMSAGDWLNASKLPKSSPAYLRALILTSSILFQWEGKSHCKPERADVQQAMAITKLYFQEHPQIWHLDAPTGIGVALGNVWPCEPQDGA